MLTTYFLHPHTPSPSMSNSPAVVIELQKRKREARSKLTDEIDDVVKDFLTSLYDIAKKHARLSSSFSPLS
jgi:hypothetical protein